jgi:hypothetical protein
VRVLPLTLLAVPALALAACSDEPEGDPETVVQAVVDARTSGECDGFEDHFVDGDPVGGCDEPQPIVGDGPQVGDAEVDGDTAEVEVTDYYDCSTWDLPPEESVDVYTLVVEDGEWLVEDIEFAETTSDDCF